MNDVQHPLTTTTSDCGRGKIDEFDDVNPKQRSQTTACILISIHTMPTKQGNKLSTVELSAPIYNETKRANNKGEMEHLLVDTNATEVTGPHGSVDDSPLVATHSPTLHPSSEWWDSTVTELQAQSTTAFPALQSLVLSKLPWLISLRFLGGIGGEELAAAALATTLHNVTGMRLAVGFSFALSTLAGQAKGEMMSRKHFTTDSRSDAASTMPPITPIVYLIRGMCIQLCLVLPIGLW